MAESTLARDDKDLEARVGEFLGYGKGALFNETAWSTTQQSVITDCVKSGQSQFLYPPAVEGEVGSYEWSFLQYPLIVVLPSGANTVPLPDDFGSFVGQMTISSVQGQVWYPFDSVTLGTIYEQEAQFPTMTSRPRMYCDEPLKALTSQSGQRRQVHVFPKADSQYTLKAVYNPLPSALSAAFPYTYGGAAHAETLREACLKAAEEYLDDRSENHAGRFMERLRASISIDRKNKAQMIGVNRDCSDYRLNVWERRDQHGLSPVTVGGVSY